MRSIFALTIAIHLNLVACSQQETVPAAPAELPLSTQFSFDEGTERDAVWSPDGKWILFGGGQGNQQHLWKMPASGGEVIQLTSGSSFNVFPAWSPDGTQIAYCSNRDGKFNIWTVPAAGGEPTRITSDEDQVTPQSPPWGASGVAWSPDGTQLAFSSIKGVDRDIWIISVAGGTPWRLTSNPAEDGFPDWSPDGTEIAFTSTRAGNWDLWIIPALGGTARQVTDHAGDDWFGVWSPDGKRLVFTSTRDGRFDIWIVPAAGGAAVPITNTPDYENSPSWSPDGRKILFHRRVATSSLWVMPDVDGEPVGLAEVGGWTGAGGSWSPDGEEIVFIKLSPQGRAIWKIPVSSGDPIQLTPGGILSHSRTGLSFSPDGREIAFTSTKDGETNIWTMPASGGDAHQITLTPGYDTFLSYSPDGRRIAFSSSDSGSADIWAVPSSGGMPVRLVDWPTLEWGPDWSPDGQQIAFVSNRAQTGEVVDDIWYLWLLPVGGGEAVYLTEGFTPDWSPAGGEILFAHQGDIWKIPAAGGEPSRLLETPKSEEFWPRFSADGSKILFTRSVGTGGADIWIADVSGI